VSFAWAFGVLLIIYLFPLTTVVFLGLVLVCGIYDFLRNGLYDRDTFKKYFIGSGRIPGCWHRSTPCSTC